MSSRRTSHALYAAVAAALIAVVTTFLLLVMTDKQGDIVFFVPRVAMATSVTTYALWWLTFSSSDHGLVRAAWVGVLIPVISMFVLWTGLSIFATGNLDHFLAVGVLAALGLWLFGPVLITVGGVSAILVRWTQLRSMGTPADPPAARSHLEQVPGKSRWRMIAVAVLGMSAIGAAWLAYQILEGENVRFTSISPSGKYTLRTVEACLGHACSHNAGITVNTGSNAAYSEPCDLNIIADYPYFTPGASMSWSDDETVVNWRSADGETGKVDLRQECGHRLPVHSPSLKRSLFITESCLSGACRRRITLRVDRPADPSSSGLYLCQSAIRHGQRLFTASSATPTFEWNTDESAVLWRTSKPPYEGHIEFAKDCRLQ